ncbi:MAG: hypothetical protein HOV80_09335 [Polyangiaceae bacterium]|nr:hypothetical protein [Polyangiaceae bacterium]
MIRVAGASALLLASAALMVACGSPVSAIHEATPTAASPAAAPSLATPSASTPPPEASASAAPSEPPRAEISGTTVKLTYGGQTHMLSEGIIIKLQRHMQLVFREPETEGLHELRLLLPAGTQLREAATIDGTGQPTLFLQLADGRRARDVSSSCSAKGTATVNVLAPDGHGKIDVTIRCDGVPELAGPFVLRGEFYDMKFGK